MQPHFPYAQLSNYQKWREDFQLQSQWWAPNQPQCLDKETVIASAGSCFARRIAGYLKQRGFCYLNQEPGPPWFSEEEKRRHNYGIYSARYGNVYTSLQLLQLLERALGHFQPQELSWNGFQGFVDPFRPTVQRDGFASEVELMADQKQHLAAVKRVFEQAEVFIVTLGLTECWLSQEDGALFPMCPGGRFGNYDPAKYRFHNLSVSENIAYLTQFLALLLQINPGVQVIMSVSPVPLAATQENQHIIQATLYSKSVLRVAVDEVCRQFEAVHYFASYDMVQHAFHPHSLFEIGSRQLSDAGLQWVMEAFVSQFSALDPKALRPVETEAGADVSHDPCDEEELLKLIQQDFHS